MKEAMIFVLMFTAEDVPHYECSPLTAHVLNEMPLWMKKEIMWHAQRRGLYFPDEEIPLWSNFDGVMQIVVHRWRGTPLPYPVDPFGPKPIEDHR